MNEKGNQMKTYLVYQLPFEHSLKRDVPILETFQIKELSDEYVVVAEIKASSLDEVFRINNFVSEKDMHNLTFLDEMHSISVGDIIVDVEEDKEYVVANYGFDRIEMKSEVV